MPEFYQKFSSLQKKIWWAFMGFALFYLCLRILFVSVYDPGKARDFIHGDSYSEKNAYSSAKLFYDHGFAPTVFLPYHFYDHGKKLKGATYDQEGNLIKLESAYTHYPALPDLLTGFYTYVFQTTDERVLRVIPVIISLFFLVVVFQVLWRFFKDTQVVLLSGLIIGLSNYYLFWADNFHKHLYEELCKWTFLYLMHAYYTGGFKKLTFVLAFVVFILATNISYETVPYMAIITVGLSWIYERKIFSWETVIMGVSPFIGFGLHIWQVAVYRGSLELVYEDFTNVLTMRTVGDHSTQNEMGRPMALTDYLSIPWVWFYRIERYFLVSGATVMVLGYFAWNGLKREGNKNLLGLMVVLFIATISWNIVMSQHAYVHSFTARHAGILIAFISGYGILQYRQKFLQDWNSGVLWKQALHVLFVGYSLVVALTVQVWDLIRYAV